MAMHALHAQEARGVGGDGRDAHERAAQGCANAIRQLHHQVTGLGGGDATAKVDKGPLGLVDRVGGSLEGLPPRLDGRRGHHGKPGLVVGQSGLHVLGNVHQDGALAVAHGQLKGLVKDLLQTIDVANEVVLLGDG